MSEKEWNKGPQDKQYILFINIRATHSLFPLLWKGLHQKQATQLTASNIQPGTGASHEDQHRSPRSHQFSTNTTPSSIRLLSTEAHDGLDGTVDPPLQTSESTNHNNTSSETLEEEILGSHFGGHGSPGLVLVLRNTLHGYKVVHRLSSDSAEDTGPITASKGDGELGALREIGLLVASLLLDLSIHKLCGLVETDKLDHGVRDLKIITNVNCCQTSQYANLKEL